MSQGGGRKMEAHMNLCLHCRKELEKRAKYLKQLLPIDQEREHTIQQLYWMIDMDYKTRSK